MIRPTNDLALLGIGAGHARRLELADKLFFPVLVDIQNTGIPLQGGYVGNRGGTSAYLAPSLVGAAYDSAGNAGAYSADYSPLTGDPMAAVKTKTADGDTFYVKRYDGQGIITVEDPTFDDGSGTGPYANLPRYIVKADGMVYDVLELRGADAYTAGGGVTNLQHWEFANDTGGTFDMTDGYIPSARFQNPSLITADDYIRPVGFLSIRDKSGASSGLIQEELSRTQSSIDVLSRMLRSLHDESKGPLANIVPR